jgi:arylsulfatase A-like enzyme
MPRRPDIIYIVSDEHRGQAMGHAGDVNLRTPAMDGLAAGGVSFQRAYSNCPVCVPARGTLLSGRHAHAGPVSGFWDNYKVGAPSTATILRRHGYRTCFIGKWHLGWVRDQTPPAVRADRARYRDCAARTPERHRAGFEDWYAYEAHNQHVDGYYYRQRDLNPTPLTGYITDNMTDLALEYLASPPDEPVFLTLSICPPHFPLVAPQAWQRLDPAALAVRPTFADTPQHRGELATYYAMIENLDWNIGRLMEFLRGSRRFQDAIVVYLSDHGEYLHCHGFGIGKEHPHEESVRIPAIFSAPGRIKPQGLVDAGLFSLVDLLPTTLSLLGLPAPSYCQGADFSPLLRGEPFPQAPAAVLLEMISNPRTHMGLLDWRGFVAADTKYAFYEDGRELLYNLRDDPFEQHNLAGSHPAQRDDARRRLRELLAATREPYFDVLMDNCQPPDQPDVDAARH